MTAWGVGGIPFNVQAFTTFHLWFERLELGMQRRLDGAGLEVYIK
jgi:hypothetical protein